MGEFTALNLAAWLAEKAPDEMPPPEFWKSLVIMPREQHTAILEIYDCADAPIGSRKRPFDDSDEEGESTSPKNRRFSSDEEDEWSDGDALPETDKDGNLAGFIDDEIVYDDEEDTDGDDEAPPSTMISPADVGKQYGVMVDGKTEYFQLEKWDKEGNHTIRWFERKKGIRNLSRAMKKRIRHVEKIDGTALFLTDHEQPMSPDVDGGWTDVTEQMLFTRVIPKSSIEPITLYVIGEYSFAEEKIVTDMDDTVDLVVKQLLHMGSKDDQDWLLEQAHQIDLWKNIKPIHDRCMACGRTRTLTRAFKCTGNATWFNVGCYCAKRIDVASKLLGAKDEDEQQELMADAAEALAASRR